MAGGSKGGGAAVGHFHHPVRLSFPRFPWRADAFVTLRRSWSNVPSIATPSKISSLPAQRSFPSAIFRLPVTFGFRVVPPISADAARRPLLDATSGKVIGKIDRSPSGTLIDTASGALAKGRFSA